MLSVASFAAEIGRRACVGSPDTTTEGTVADDMSGVLSLLDRSAASRRRSISGLCLCIIGFCDGTELLPMEVAVFPSSRETHTTTPSRTSEPRGVSRAVDENVSSAESVVAGVDSACRSIGDMLFSNVGATGGVGCGWG